MKENVRRRHFIKTASLASAGIIGAFTSGCTTTKLINQPDPEEGCTFSELPDDFVYLNSGTEGSMPECVLTTLNDNLSKWASNPTTSYELDQVLGKRQELNRQEVANFFNVGKNNICITDNTTMGLSMTLMGLNFSSQDKVVLTNHEHTAMISPLLYWKSRIGLQIEIRSFPSPSELKGMSVTELFDSLFPDSPALRGAKALCVSHIYPTTGIRLPLRLLREKVNELNIRYLIVDGAQGPGMIDVTKGEDSIEYSDFYACPGHKWLNGPPSTGVLYIKNENIRPPEFYPTISQRMVKFTNFSGDTLNNFPMAEALQIRGCCNTPGFTAMVRAMKLVEEEGGMTTIEDHILNLSQEIKNFILAHSPDSMVSPHSDTALLSGMTVFFPFSWDDPQSLFTDKKTSDRVVKKLLEKNVQIRAIHIPNKQHSPQSGDKLYALRVSTAHFNTIKDVEVFKENLQDILKQIG